MKTNIKDLKRELKERVDLFNYRVSEETEDFKESLFLAVKECNSSILAIFAESTKKSNAKLLSIAGFDGGFRPLTLQLQKKLLTLTLPETEEEELLTLEDVSKMTGLHKATIYKKMKAGDFPHNVKIGAAPKGWRMEDIYKWNKEHGETGDVEKALLGAIEEMKDED